MLQYFYSPGDPRNDIFRTAFIEAASKFKYYRRDYWEVHFVMVNCNKHYQYCRNHDFTRLPYTTLTLPTSYPKEKLAKFRMDSQFPSVEYEKDFTLEGIEYFLRENAILPPLDFTKPLLDLLP